MHDRLAHLSFLESELKAQTDRYVHLVLQSAESLRQAEEVYPSQFVKFENGEMILKFRGENPYPRSGQYFSGVLLRDEKRSYKNWGNLSWAELCRSYQTERDEMICTWVNIQKDTEFIIAGFRGISITFAEKLIPKCLITLGPKEPPIQYLKSLIATIQQLIQVGSPSFIDKLTEQINPIPREIPKSGKISHFLNKQLQLAPHLIIQGPPGTGKTYLMATLCDELLSKGERVLVIALTNKALTELAMKPVLAEKLQAGHIHKCSLSWDERVLIPALLYTKEPISIKGDLCLATFFVASEFSLHTDPELKPFDTVIMDEASQALLGMFECASKLGKKIIFIGDQKQLSPVLSMNSDEVDRKAFRTYANGFWTICRHMAIPSFQLTATYRLTVRAARYTSIFYSRPLESVAQRKVALPLEKSPLSNFFRDDYGPALIKLNLPIAEEAPKQGLLIIMQLIQELHRLYPGEQVTILSKTRKAVRAIQGMLLKSGMANETKVETVERVQGMTTDHCILFIPNSKMGLSLNNAFFNVATSRAKWHTVILADSSISTYPLSEGLVKLFLNKLDAERSLDLSQQSSLLLSSDQKYN